MLDRITASLICMDLSDIKTDIDTLLENGVDRLHADFMDNTFVPRLGISPELIQWIRKRYGNNVYIDSHLMVKDPISCLDVIAPYSNWVFFHNEAVSDPLRVLQAMDKYEVNKGVAYNVGTSVNIPLINTDLVVGLMFMGISPGVLGTRSWPDLISEKISSLRGNIIGGEMLPIFVDGGVSFNSMKYLGADTMVCGSSTLFKIDKETELMDREEMIKFNIGRIEEALK